jgi:ribosomal protein S12 methylthiotransferase accessory factor
MGITRIANVTGLDRIGIPVVMVTRPGSRALSVAQGKGVDLLAAQVSGFMEAVESYHGERVLRPLVVGAYQELRSSHRIVDLALLPQPVDAVYDPSWRSVWVEGYDILRDESVLVPYDLVHTDFRVVDRSWSTFFKSSSNGLSSGNHVLEAVSHAICELIERDATCLQALEERTVRENFALANDTVSDELCRRMLELFDSAGVAVAIWDMTSDIGLPAFSCLVGDDPSRSPYVLPIGEGCGCHTSREIALLRALTEAAQSRLTFIAGTRDDTFPEEYARPTEDSALRNLLLRTAASGKRDFRDSPNYETETVDEDVRLELDRLRSVGLDSLVVLDLSHPRFGIPVIRVIAPGLETGFVWPETRYGPRALRVIRHRITEFVDLGACS